MNKVKKKLIFKYILFKNQRYKSNFVTYYFEE